MSLATAMAPVARVARDVIAGTAREIAELHLSGSRGRHGGMTALAVALATVVALMVRVDAAWWAAISAFVSFQTTAPASVQRGTLRIAGTAAGAVIALLLSPWLANDHLALCLVLLIASTSGVLGLLVDQHGYAWLLGAVTIDMVLLAAWSDPVSALETACNRTAEVVIGTLAAMTVALLLLPYADPAAASSPAPGWSDLLGAQWPAVQHALRAGIAVMLVPLVWSWLDLPSLSQTAITAAAVMAVPALSNDAPTDQQRITERAVHRILGCLFGGVAGLLCLMVSVQDILPWLLMLTAGIWVAAHVQGSQRGIGYVGTQGAVAFICTLIQGPGPPGSILPGIERLAGITGGLLILLTVTVLTAPSRPLAVRG